MATIPVGEDAKQAKPSFGASVNYSHRFGKRGPSYNISGGASLYNTGSSYKPSVSGSATANLGNWNITGNISSSGWRLNPSQFVDKSSNGVRMLDPTPAVSIGVKYNL